MMCLLRGLFKTPISMHVVPIDPSPVDTPPPSQWPPCRPSQSINAIPASDPDAPRDMPNKSLYKISVTRALEDKTCTIVYHFSSV